VDRRRFLTVAGGGLAGAALAGCGGSGNSSDGPIVKLVSSMPRTGSAKGQTDTIANGIQLAIDEFDHTVAGMKIVYEDWDDATAAKGSWTAELESANAKKAILDEDVMAYIGPYNSQAAGVSMPILNEAGLVQISPAVTWIGLTKKNDIGPADEPGKYRPTNRITFGRVCPTDETQGPMAADFAKSDLKAKSVYILNDREMYGQGVSGLFKKRCEKIGIQILGEEGIDASQNEFSALMGKIKGKNPDVIYFGGTTQSKGGQIAKDMRAAGITCPLIVPDGCYELSFIESAGEENLKNCYATMGGLDWVALTGPGLEFVKKYQAKYKKDPEAYAIYGYEAAKVILAAIKLVGKKDREAILKTTLDPNREFSEGALGKWNFDEDGDISLQNFTISKIEGGRFKPVKIVDKAR
jgi:branched-chain amino acid transport system substrate-binding protein